MQDPGFTTDSMSELFGPQGRVKAWLEVEAVLAESQAEVGVIPEPSASAIAATCRSLEPDAEDMLAQGWNRGTPILPLLDQIRSQLPTDYHGHLHFETTTQDIVDTALTWRASQGIKLLEEALLEVAETCVALADDHRATWMTGRTFLQAAQPSTFGAKAALWLDAIASRWRYLIDASDDLTVQLGGPVSLGTGMEGRADAVAALMAKRLGLRASAVAWQSDREPIVTLGARVASVARTVEKVATDLTILAQTEVAEVRMRPGESSAMPHKRNPVDATRAMTAPRVAVSAAAGLLTSPPPRLERDGGAWLAEWHLISEIFGATDVSLHALGSALSGVEVDQERMEANLDSALGAERPDRGGIDRLIDSAIAAFEKTRSSREGSVG
jgi:3-carboxy-cis,cis-muconate cycloisomerase